jgi:hypothetical protein
MEKLYLYPNSKSVHLAEGREHQRKTYNFKVSFIPRATFSAVNALTFPHHLGSSQLHIFLAVHFLESAFRAQAKGDGSSISISLSQWLLSAFLRGH